MNTQNQCAYRSAAAQSKALANYDKLIAHWPVPVKSQMINTSYGETHVLISGDADAKPLVLLHGGGGNSSMWMVNIAELVKHFCVYMIDIIGEPGKSAGTRPAYKSNSHALWLNEVIQNLQLSPVALCGISLGSWVAQQFALQFPEKLTHLILLAPPALLSMRPQFVLFAVAAVVLPIPSLVFRFLNYISTTANQLPNEAKQNFLIQWQAYKPSNDQLPVNADKDIIQLPEKTLILIPEKEVLYDANKAIKRVRSIAPQIKSILIPGAGHVITIDKPDLVNKEIISFVFADGDDIKK